MFVNHQLGQRMSLFAVFISASKNQKVHSTMKKEPSMSNYWENYWEEIFAVLRRFHSWFQFGNNVIGLSKRWTFESRPSMPSILSYFFKYRKIRFFVRLLISFGNEIKICNAIEVFYQSRLEQFGFRDSPERSCWQ